MRITGERNAISRVYGAILRCDEEASFKNGPSSVFFSRAQGGVWTCSDRRQGALC